jgi:hypothetical protein
MIQLTTEILMQIIGELFIKNKYLEQELLQIKKDSTGAKK